MKTATNYSKTLDSLSNILPLPAFEDNYIWLIHHNKQAVVIDPGQADPVYRALDKMDLQLCAILLTHHHADHVGGVAELSKSDNVKVYGPANERLPVCHERLAQGDRVSLPALEIDLNVLDVPGHTAGHIAYYGQVGHLPHVLFCGDTLFAAGCGRLFEGSPEQMVQSLKKFSCLPPQTQVFCAHEYTLNNLRWALTVEPAHLALQQRFLQARILREQQRPTLPSSIGEELDTNPFLRIDQPSVKQAAMAHAGSSLNSSTEVFTALREWKNNFS